MALESATYIDGLNASNPPSGDPVLQGSNHVRLLKSTILSTFPNITGPVTATQDQLNGFVPAGAVVMWYSTVATIPTGWAQCDGGTYNLIDGSGTITAPDMRNLFPVGTGTTYAVGTTGGLAATTPTITGAGFTLSTNELPNLGVSVSLSDPGHSHTVTDPGHNHGVGYVSVALKSGVDVGVQGIVGPGSTSTFAPTVSGGTNVSIQGHTTGITATGAFFGGNAAHTHTATSSAVPTIPPYRSVVFMMKL